MARCCGLLLVQLACLGFFAGALRKSKKMQEAPLNTFTLNVTVHLVPNFNVTRLGQNLDSWVSERDFVGVFQDMNEIYRSTGIQWQGQVKTHTCVGLGTCTSRPVETSSGTFTPSCAKQVLAQTDYRASRSNAILVRNAVYSQLDPAGMNIHEFHAWMLPYNGQTSQGRANREQGWGNALTMGIWTDKNGPLRKRALTGGWYTEQGSIAKTLAHELGHQLGLGHGAPATRLMQSAGLPQDVAFTSADLSTVRQIAATGRPKLKSDRDSVPKYGKLSTVC